jgi:trimeric autotransporter adhesin
MLTIIQGGENVKKNMFKIPVLLALTLAFTIVLSGAAFATADVNVTKVVNPGDASTNVGDSFNYTIVAGNNAQSDETATGVKITDILPADLTFNNWQASQGTYNSTTGIWDVGSLIPGATAWLNLNVTINPSAAGKHIPNTAYKSWQDQGTDPTTGAGSDDISTAWIYVPAAHIDIEKFFANYDQFKNNNYNIVPITSPVNYLDNVVAVLKFTNMGPDSITIQSWNEIWPSGLTGTGESWLSFDGGLTWFFIGYSPQTGDNLWSSAGQSPGQIWYLVIAATVNVSNTTITNTVETTDQVPYDPIGYDSVSADLQVNPAAHVDIEKFFADYDQWINNHVIVPITEANYTDTVLAVISATNMGPDPVTNLSIFDTWPATGLAGIGSTWVSIDSGATWHFEPFSPPGSWTFTPTYYGPIAPGATAYDVIAVNVTTSNTTISNTATTTGQTPVDVQGFDSDTGTLEVAAAAIVGVNKYTSNARPNVGETFYYTIAVNNIGPDAATGVQVTDLLPPTLQFLAADTHGVGTYDSGSGVWDIGTIAPGITDYLTLYASPLASAAGTTVTNTATKTAENEYSDNPGVGSVDIYVPLATVGVNKYTSNATPNVGETFYYTIAVNNIGPDAATGVQVTDLLPPTLQFLAADTHGVGTYDSGTGLWDIGTIAPGVTDYLTLYVAPLVSAAGKTVTNTATKTAQNEYSNNPGVGSVDIRVPVASVSVEKGFADSDWTTDIDTADYLDNVYSWIWVWNYGPDAASGVVVSDTFPDTLDLIPSSAEISYNSGTTWMPIDSSVDITGQTVTWTIGNMPNGAIYAFRILSTVLGHDETISNTVTEDQTTYNPNPQYNEYTAFLDVPPAADVYVTINSSNTNPCLYHVFNTTIKVGNNGPDVADDVVMNLPVPTGVEFLGFLSWTSGMPSYNSLTRTITWDLDDLDAFTEQTLVANFRATTTGVKVFDATVDSETYDYDMTNNEDTVNVTAKNCHRHCGGHECAAGTVPMQDTGAPVIPLLLGALSVLAGFAAHKR